VKPRLSLLANDSIRFVADLWMVKFERRLTQNAISANRRAAIRGTKERITISIS
jgi:hypothetical protein